MNEQNLNKVFKNRAEKEIFMFLVVLHKWLRRVITDKEFIEYIDAHTPPKTAHDPNFDKMSREEKNDLLIKELIEITTKYSDSEYAAKAAEAEKYV